MRPSVRYDLGRAERLSYVEGEDFWRGDTSIAFRPKKGTALRPDSIDSVAGHYAARAQRMDMLDSVSQESGDQKPSDHLGPLES